VTNFRCGRCEFTTTRRDKLKAHIDSKHYGKRFKCLECFAEFTRNNSLERHIKSFHPKDPLAPISMDWVEEIERKEITTTPDPVVPPAPVQEKSQFNIKTCLKEMVYKGRKRYLESLHKLQRKK